MGEGAVKWSLDELLPHREPMMLLEAVETFDPEARRLTARVRVTPEQVALFGNASGVPNWVAIEYMAQTSAALAGCWDRHVAPDRPARPGLLLGTLKFELGIDRFEACGVYHVTAEDILSDEDAASFACSIRDDAGHEVAKANLNAYRPPDMARFLKEQMKA